MSETDPVLGARLEGLAVEADYAIRGFQSAAVDYIRNEEHRIVRDFPQYYTNEQRHAAGVPATWKDVDLYPEESLSWWRWNALRLTASRERADG